VRRLLWLGVGIAVGAIVARQVTKAIKAYSPASLAGSARNSAAGFLESVQDFIADVREGMAEREAAIHEAIEQGVTLEELEELDHGRGDRGL
jgi:hypothetical protein